MAQIRPSRRNRPDWHTSWGGPVRLARARAPPQPVYPRAAGSGHRRDPESSTGRSQVRHRRTALGDDRVDLLLRPPVARLRGLDFKGGIALIDAGYRYAAEELSKSGLAKQFMT